jgi:hypothetical protein
MKMSLAAHRPKLASAVAAAAPDPVGARRSRVSGTIATPARCLTRSADGPTLGVAFPLAGAQGAHATGLRSHGQTKRGGVLVAIDRRGG